MLCVRREEIGETHIQRETWKQDGNHVSGKNGKGEPSVDPAEPSSGFSYERTQREEENIKRRKKKEDS